MRLQPARPLRILKIPPRQGVEVARGTKLILENDSPAEKPNAKDFLPVKDLDLESSVLTMKFLVLSPYTLVSLRFVPGLDGALVVAVSNSPA